MKGDISTWVFLLDCRGTWGGGRESFDGGFCGCCVEVVWRLCGGCVVVVWRLCGGCVMVMWGLCGGFKRVLRKKLKLLKGVLGVFRVIESILGFC